MEEREDVDAPQPFDAVPTSLARAEFWPTHVGTGTLVTLTVSLLPAVLVMGLIALMPVGLFLRLVCGGTAALLIYCLALFVRGRHPPELPWAITDAEGITFPYEQNLHLPWSGIRRLVLDRGGSELVQLYVYLKARPTPDTEPLVLLVPLALRQRQELVAQLKLALPAGAVLEL